MAFEWQQLTFEVERLSTHRVKTYKPFNSIWKLLLNVLLTYNKVGLGESYKIEPTTYDLKVV